MLSYANIHRMENSCIKPKPVSVIMTHMFTKLLICIPNENQCQLIHSYTLRAIALYLERSSNVNLSSLSRAGL